MTPEIVRFDGLEIYPKKLLERRYIGPTPVDWVRYQYFLEDCFTDPEYHLTEWLKNNIGGRFTINTDVNIGGSFIVLGFESQTDAVMFKMRGGEKAWLKNQKEFL
jgi:hypothetical protein